jgi:hypothetical protein
VLVYDVHEERPEIETFTSNDVAKERTFRSKKQQKLMLIAIAMVVAIDTYYFVSFSICDYDKAADSNCYNERITYRQHSTLFYFITVIMVGLNVAFIAAYLYVLISIVIKIRQLYLELYQ